MVKERSKQARTYRLLWLAVLVMTAGLAVWIRPAADDFYYRTFTDGGWQQFWENHLEHYQIMSGRVFVHVLLNPLLLLDMWPMRVFFVLLIALFGLLAAKLCARGCGDRTAAMVLALSVFWLQGLEPLADGALWGAGAMNYLFPVTLVLLYVAGLQWFLGGGGGLWLCLPAFLCACTVEMNGILPLVAFCYLCLTHWEQARLRSWRTVLIGFSTVLGYWFLYTSPGVALRLSGNESGLPLLEKILCNYALIDRKAVGPEGIWLVVVLTLASCGGILLQAKKRGWAALYAVGAAVVTLTGLGIVYDGIAVAVAAICVFSMLAGFAVWSFLRGERQVPLWMLCSTISLGVTLVSPVMGARLIMPTGMMLTILFVRNMMLLDLPGKWRLRLTALIAAAACVVLLDYTLHAAENARIIDANTHLTENHDGSETLVLTRVPDEDYSAATVPSGSNFGHYYLLHHGLEGVRIRCRELESFDILWEDGLLEGDGMLRRGQHYIPLRSLASICGAQVTWELASAVVEHAGRQYCFHEGNHVANLGHGICPSIKLQYPVRTINERICISVADCERLFGVDLTLVPVQGE